MLIGILCSAWTFVMGFTGRYKNSGARQRLVHQCSHGDPDRRADLGASPDGSEPHLRWTDSRRHDDVDRGGRNHHRLLARVYNDRLSELLRGHRAVVSNGIAAAGEERCGDCRRDSGERRQRHADGSGDERLHRNAGDRHRGFRRHWIVRSSPTSNPSRFRLRRADNCYNRTWHVSVPSSLQY